MDFERIVQIVRRMSPERQQSIADRIAAMILEMDYLVDSPSSSRKRTTNGSSAKRLSAEHYERVRAALPGLMKKGVAYRAGELIELLEAEGLNVNRANFTTTVLNPLVETGSVKWNAKSRSASRYSK
jgi:hypothetical protein